MKMAGNLFKHKILGRVFALIIFILCAWGHIYHPLEAATLDASQVTDLYSQAKDLFKQANEAAASDPDRAQGLYAKAAMRFERIIKEGDVNNGRLYYNLANVYFRMKDIGRAIVNYRRAEQFIPNDSNLKQNLEYARKKRLDDIEEKQETRVLKTLFFWHYDLSTKTRVVIFTICFASVWIFAAIRIFAVRSFLNWSILASVALSLLLAGSLAADEINLRKERPGVIISPEVIARKGNSDTYEPSFKEPLHCGTEFVLVEDRGAWYRIELADSRTSWVPSKDVEMVR
jgi:tetratricopeptide (TPR) repeat protein